MLNLKKFYATQNIRNCTYSLKWKQKKNIKTICAPSFQILEDRQNRGSISERESRSNADPVKCLAYCPSYRYSQHYPRSSYWIERQRLNFFGEKCFKVFKFAKLEHQKRDGETEKTYKERKGVDTYTVYALWESLERSLSLKLSIILWFRTYTMGMWEKRVNCKAHNTRIFSIILRNAF